MELKLLIAGVVLFILARIMKKSKERIDRSAAPTWKKVYAETYEWIETGWSAVLLAAFIMYFFVQAFKIPSGSMRVTLMEGDYLFVNKFVYGFHIPLSGGKRVAPLRKVTRGDIVVFKCPPAGLSPDEQQKKADKDFIKRCVAIAGDIVEIKDRVLYVNGALVSEPYTTLEAQRAFARIEIYESPEQYQRLWETGQFARFSPEMVRDNFGPVTVPAGHYFMMGDNRDRSFDGRFWGPVADKYIKGKPLVLYWPPRRMRVIR